MGELEDHCSGNAPAAIEAAAPPSQKGYFWFGLVDAIVIVRPVAGEVAYAWSRLCQVHRTRLSRDPRVYPPAGCHGRPAGVGQGQDRSTVATSRSSDPGRSLGQRCELHDAGSGYSRQATSAGRYDSQPRVLSRRCRYSGAVANRQCPANKLQPKSAMTVCCVAIFWSPTPTPDQPTSRRRRFGQVTTNKPCMVGTSPLRTSGSLAGGRKAGETQVGYTEGSGTGGCSAEEMEQSGGRSRSGNRSLLHLRFLLLMLHIQACPCVPPTLLPLSSSAPRMLNHHRNLGEQEEGWEQCAISYVRGAVRRARVSSSVEIGGERVCVSCLYLSLSLCSLVRASCRPCCARM